MTILVGGGGGLKPPTSLQNNLSQGTGSFSSNMALSMATTTSSSITSATLTEVLNISGAGVLTFSALTCTIPLTDYKITIVVDGVTALSELAGGTLNSTGGRMVIGTYNNNQEASVEGVVTFNSSLVVNIAGDGTNGAIYHYKRYLT